MYKRTAHNRYEIGMPQLVMVSLEGKIAQRSPQSLQTLQTRHTVAYFCNKKHTMPNEDRRPTRHENDVIFRHFQAQTGWRDSVDRTGSRDVQTANRGYQQTEGCVCSLPGEARLTYVEYDLENLMHNTLAKFVVASRALFI